MTKSLRMKGLAPHPVRAGRPGPPAVRPAGWRPQGAGPDGGRDGPLPPLRRGLPSTGRSVAEREWGF
jgi:hypothetical protein